MGSWKGVGQDYREDVSSGSMWDHGKMWDSTMGRWGLWKDARSWDGARKGIMRKCGIMGRCGIMG